MKALEKPKAAADMVAHPVEPIDVNVDDRAYARVGWLIVLVGVVGFLLWAIFAPLDKGVPMSGTVASESNRKAIQHPTGGTVQDILVHDGDTVKVGQVLLRMNTVQAKSQADITRVQYYTARATEARLLAERDGSSSLHLPPELEKRKNDPELATVIDVQRELFNSRRASLQNDLAAMQAAIDGLKVQVKGLQDGRASKKEQMAMLKEQLDGMRDLSKDGYVARNRLLDLERTYAQLAGSISEDVGNIGRGQAQIAETTLRRAQRAEDYQKEVRSQLADVQKEAEALEARMSAQDFDLANTDVKSPVSGTVVNLSVFTRGAVVAPGFRLMDIVPAGDQLVVEGKLPVNLVDRVHAGLKVDLIFSAFNANRTPHIPGVVTTVAADSIVDEHSGQAYYKVRAKVTPEGAKLLAQNKMDVQPGMPVELFVRTGERTMMNYLLKPIIDRAGTSLSEE